MLGAMTSSPEKLDDRAIFYKHDDTNFYPALSYVIGQALASIPQMLIDVLLFGTFVYWLVGFVVSAKGFLLVGLRLFILFSIWCTYSHFDCLRRETITGRLQYLALFFSFNFTCGQMFGVLASIAPSKSAVQAGGAFLLLLNVFFCGFIVSPTVIPGYYIWIYWLAPLAWVYRALLLNEFLTDDYADGEGQAILATNGFLYESKTGQQPFTREWIAYCFAYLFSFTIVCMVSSAACLHYLRMEPKPTGVLDMPETEEIKDALEKESGNATFIPVTLAFKDLSYEVKASTGSEKLRLLSNVSGVFTAGRMCAL